MNEFDRSSVFKATTPGAGHFELRRSLYGAYMENGRGKGSGVAYVWLTTGNLTLQPGT